MPIRQDTILVVEDDKNIVKLLEYNLKNTGFRVIITASGESAIRQCERKKPALVILDLMLPGMSGISVCKQLKAQKNTAHIPIIMLTAKSDELDKISGFQVGADDYVTKPFSPEELVLRIKAILRRRIMKEKDERLKTGKIILDRERHEVAAGGKKIDLTATEFRLLEFFLDNKGKLLSRDILLSNVWEYDSDIDTRTVDSHVKTLRHRLAKTGVKITTVRGFGYKLEG